ncbi:MAG: trigger factor [Candidatus Moranbacteria bacterium]|nr:trigger factor [Candidatus Moranbacteria bacterium]
MDVQVKKLPKSKVEIAVSIPWNEWKGEIDHAVEHLAKDVNVQGFRPGHAPREVIEKKIGKTTVLIEGAEHAIDHLFPKVLEAAKIDAIGKPEIRLDDVQAEGPLSFLVTTSVMPEVRLGSWEKKVKKENSAHAKEKLTVDDAEIAEELRKIAESRTKFVTVDREARDGDMVETDFEVTMNGVPIEGGTGKKHPVVLGKGAFIPGFEEGILGMRAGDEKSVELVFPETYHVDTLAGKPAIFHIVANLVQERLIPELSDEFARSLGNFESLESLRGNVSDGLLEERKAKAKERLRTGILESIVETAEAELPDVLVESEVRRMIGEFGNQASMMGLKLEDYLARMKKTEEELAKEWRPQAEKRILSELSIERIATDQAIEPGQEEIEEEMNKILAYAKSVSQAERELDLPAMYAASRNRLRNEKVFEWLERL